MTKLEWDKTGERFYSTGVSHGVLYIPNSQGRYLNGYPWNGLVSVTDTPSGAESNRQYADNIVYANIKSTEEVGGTIEAFQSPREFDQCDGTRELAPGIRIGQQTRRSFGFSWQSLVGNDTEGTDYGFDIHLVYGADANPSEKQYQTVNDSPEAATLSWEYTTTPVAVPGFKPAAKLTIRSTDLTEAQLQTLTDILYGTAGSDPRLPLPAELAAITSGSVVTISPARPTQAGNVITIPAVTGAVYSIDGIDVEPGAQPPITEDVIVSVRPTAGYTFPGSYDSDWTFTHS